MSKETTNTPEASLGKFFHIDVAEVRSEKGDGSTQQQFRWVSNVTGAMGPWCGKHQSALSGGYEHQRLLMFLFGKETK